MSFRAADAAGLAFQTLFNSPPRRARGDYHARPGRILLVDEDRMEADYGAKHPRRNRKFNQSPGGCLGPGGLGQDPEVPARQDLTRICPGPVAPAKVARELDTRHGAEWTGGASPKKTPEAAGRPSSAETRAGNSPNPNSTTRSPPLCRTSARSKTNCIPLRSAAPANGPTPNWSAPGPGLDSITSKVPTDRPAASRLRLRPVNDAIRQDADSLVEKSCSATRR